MISMWYSCLWCGRTNLFDFEWSRPKWLRFVQGTRPSTVLNESFNRSFWAIWPGCQPVRELHDTWCHRTSPRRLQLTWHINVTTSDVSVSKWFIMSLYIFKYEKYIQKKTIKEILQITRSNLRDVHIEFKNCKLTTWIGPSLDFANVLNWFLLCTRIYAEMLEVNFVDSSTSTSARVLDRK